MRESKRRVEDGEGFRRHFRFSEGFWEFGKKQGSIRKESHGDRLVIASS